MPNNLPLARALAAIDPRTFAHQGSVDAAFKWLRDNDPLGRARLVGLDPFWIVTKYDDIRAIEKNSAIFSNGEAQLILTSKSVDAMIRNQSGGAPQLVRTIAHMDSPDHTNYRRVVQAWFMLSSVMTLEQFVRDTACRFVARMDSLGGECEFCTTVAQKYPLRVVAHILGIPEHQEVELSILTRDLACAQDPDLSRSQHATPDSEEIGAAHEAVIRDLRRFFAALVNSKIACQDDSVTSLIASSEVCGEPIGFDKAVDYCIGLAAAGHDTTSFSIAGAVWALCEFPDLLDQLRDQPDLIPAFVDETLRWVSPIRHFMRSAREDYVLRGKQIRRGDWLMLAYVSGNRDEDAFFAPHEFRLDRSAPPHLSFGYGPHLCLGQHLAKMEMRIILEELIPRLRAVSFAGDPELAATNVVGGPKFLPIRYVLNGR